MMEENYLRLGAKPKWQAHPMEGQSAVETDKEEHRSSKNDHD